MYPENLGCTGH